MDIFNLYICKTNYLARYDVRDGAARMGMWGCGDRDYELRLKMRSVTM